MGRRSDHSADQLRALLLDAAERIVRDEGAAQLSVRKIARAVGYSPGTLYQHFGSIFELVTHLNGRTLARLAAALEAADAASDPEAQLRGFARSYLDFIGTNQRLWETLFIFSRAESAPIPNWYRARIDGLIERVALAFAGLGLTEPRAQREAAEMIWASIHAVCSLETSGKLPLVAGRGLAALIDDLVTVHVTAAKARL